MGELLGKGQFGTVYKALNTASGRVVAVKRVEIAGKTPDEIEEILSEIDVLKVLQHPSIVKYEGAARTDHHLNIVLECVRSGWSGAMKTTLCAQVRRERVIDHDNAGLRSARRAFGRQLRRQDPRGPQVSAQSRSAV
jgi:hypothetical protein